MSDTLRYLSVDKKKKMNIFLQ